ncbi:MAG: V-type ATP synthase subunit D [Halieaceae bacterium]|jgi:V/A-type H+-transporting ATPase subunit D|nr:V-type ATP synthase subunit D [Halieaceae bacterium]
MTKVSLNKSSLSRQSRLLKSYQQFLPSLDLKRKQLMAERAQAQGELEAVEKRLAELRNWVGANLPMLADAELDLHQLVRVEDVRLEQENVVGTWLPRLGEVELRVRPYGYLSKPHWLESLIERISDGLRLRLEAEVAARRVTLLDAAVRTVTQRVNLFEKVLIPRARAQIKRIRIALSDAERAAVVRSKIAKRKRAQDFAGAAP